MPICPRCCEATMPTTAYPATLDAYDGLLARSWCCGRNGWLGGIVEEARSLGPASTRFSSATRFPRRGSSIAFTPTRAKLSREEPDAGNLHVRVCEGWGWRHPHLLGILSWWRGLVRRGLPMPPSFSRSSPSPVDRVRGVSVECPWYPGTGAVLDGKCHNLLAACETVD